MKPTNASAAIITLNNCEYLFQLRSNINGIFYPNHWGLFGGALMPGENPKTGLTRELFEELGLKITDLKYFTEFTFDFSPLHFGVISRKYYTTCIDYQQFESIKLGEGHAFELFEVDTFLSKSNIVPYDAFAIWMHSKSKFNLNESNEQ